MPDPHPYRFPGIADFIAGGGVKPSFAVKIPGVFFVGRLVDALSQIPTTEPKNRADMFAVADEAIVALKAAVATAEAAYAHVLEACPPLPPAAAVASKPPEPAVKAAPTPPPAASTPKEKPLAGA